MRAFAILFVLFSMVGAGGAEGKKPGKGFWRILVKPNARWVLKNEIAEKTHGFVDTIVVETYDVRKVGTADVARLRWTHRMKDTTDPEALRGTNAGPLTQVAVTPAGLYLLTADMDDAQVAAALKAKPARSDPPKPYKGTKRNEGRYLDLRGDLVCMGQGPTPDAGECPDTCDGDVCISATDGIVGLSGNWSPGTTIFVKQ